MCGEGEFIKTFLLPGQAPDGCEVGYKCDFLLPNTDFPLKEWRAAGLNVPSGVKAQVSTVEGRLVVKIVGTLTASDRQILDERLRNWLQL